MSIAKIATDVGKAAARPGLSPNALCVVTPGTGAEFLAPLPTRALWGVGPKTAERLTALGVRTIGELAEWPEAELVRRFGKAGHDLARHARGLDERAVQPVRTARSLSKETTFSQDVTEGATLRQTLQGQAAALSQALQRKRLKGATITLKLRWPDFTTLTRQTTLAEATDRETLIATTALHLLSQVWQPGASVRLLGVGVSGLEEPGHQPSLWEEAAAPSAEQRQRAQHVLGQLQARYGASVVFWGNEWGRQQR